MGDGRYRYCNPCRMQRKTAEYVPVNNCEMCGSDIKHRHYMARFCFPCTEKRARMVQRNYKPQNDNDIARKVTAHAVKIGFLSPATDYQCVDCGRDAQCYDHRDYSKPLDVVPVCLRCNLCRGKGEPFVAPNSKHATA